MVGLGTMGAGIAEVFARAGLTVVAIEVDPAALERGLAVFLTVLEPVMVLLLGGMVLHNLVIMNYFMMQRRKEEASSEMLLRFDWIQIVQHLLLTLTFVTLVITGFALRFPDAWWAQGLGSLGLTEPVRLNLHRVAAVGLILVSLSHASYVFFTQRGRKEFRSILLRWGDLCGDFVLYTLTREVLWRRRGADAAPAGAFGDRAADADMWRAVLALCMRGLR